MYSYNRGIDEEKPSSFESELAFAEDIDESPFRDVDMQELTEQVIQMMRFLKYQK